MSDEKNQGTADASATTGLCGREVWTIHTSPDGYCRYKLPTKNEIGRHFRTVSGKPGVVMDSKGQKYERHKGGLRKLSSPNPKDHARR